MAGRARRPDTEERVVAAALTLFREQGFAQVTMEQVAAAAEVSRRTVYRRFPTKGHVVLAVPLSWLRVWDDAVAARPGMPPLQTVEAASRAVAAHIDTQPAEVLTAYAVLEESPTLESAGTIHHEWIARIVQLLAQEPDPAPPDTQHVVAGAYMGAIDAMLQHWVATGGAGSVLAATECVLERLRPIWPGRTTTAR
jgi:AcrR family transcriptional regulator